jgi:hypothetical protein
MSEYTDVTKDKAQTVGVSFNPGSIIARAKAYGAAQSPVRGLSGVVCAALEEFLTARGWGPDGAATLAKEEARLIALAARARQHGVTPAQIETALSTLIEDRLPAERTA